jgi:hypothetical protein
MSRTTVVLAFSFLALALFSGCHKMPSGQGLVAYTQQARDDAAKAEAAHKAAAARSAANHAMDALRKANKEAADAKPEAKPAADAVADAVRPLALEAVKLADLADEEGRVEDIRSSLAMRGYRLARSPAVKLLFAGMSSAVEHAGNSGYNALSDQQKRQLADAGLLADAPKLPNGDPDWKAMGATVAGWSEHAPAELNMCLAIGYSMGNLKQLALVEADALDYAAVKTPDHRLACRAVRGLAYQYNGLPLMAEREYDAVLSESGSGGPGPQMVAGAHVLLSILYLQEGDDRRSDAELTKAIGQWPDAAVLALVRSELLARSGHFDQAAKVLDDGRAVMGDKGDPWMVQEMTTRAADLRTLRDRAPTLFADPGFWRDVLERSLNAAAPKSEFAAKIRNYLIAARRFADDCLKVLPDFGPANLPSGQPADSAAPPAKST